MTATHDTVAVFDDVLWAQIRAESQYWTEPRRRHEFAAYFDGQDAYTASTAQMVEFLRLVRYVGAREHLRFDRFAIPRSDTGIDYSDLAAAGPSATVEEAWENVGNYVRQRDRSLSAYVVDPRVNVEVCDEITPTHVLRWSSLEVLLASRVTGSAVAS